MHLKEILKGVPVEKIAGNKNILIKGVSSHSAEVKPDYIFVALKGKSRNGYNFISEAIERGAIAIVTDEDFTCYVGNTTCVYVKDTHEAIAKIADNFHNNPTKDIKVVGVTGTNGKTSVSYFINTILTSQGLSSGRIGTIDYCWGQRVIPSFLTTPPPVFLSETFNTMKTDKVEAVVMEVSSHSLAQKRVNAVQFDSCIFTNIERDHLDYHLTLSDYISSKKKLIDLLHSSSKKNKFLVLNGDDKILRSFSSSGLPHVFYGLNEANNVYALDAKFDWNGTKFMLNSPWYKGEVETPLVGNFNLYNILAAISWAGMDGLNMNSVIESFKNIKQVTGRFHVFRKNGVKAVVDYAHTPDALEKVIKTIRELTEGKVITVFGCGGDRDKGKRPLMGGIASKNSDYVIITSDNPRSENPLGIIEDIKKGISGNNWLAESNRVKAIEKGVGMLDDGDVLLVAGKGHENYQILKDTVISFSDIEVVKGFLFPKGDGRENADESQNRGNF